MSLPTAALRFPADAADRLALTPVVHDLLNGNITIPGGSTLSDRLLDVERATVFVVACHRDQRRFSSHEQAARALLTRHRSVAASLALAHAVVELLEPAA